MPLAESLLASIICHQAEQNVVMLGEAIEPGFGIMISFNDADGNLSARIIRSAVICSNRYIRRAAFKCCAIEMKQRRHRENHAGVDHVNPGKIAEYILFALAAMARDAGWSRSSPSSALLATSSTSP